MAIKNQEYYAYYKAWDNANLEWKTGDVANHTIRTILDGAETAADNAPAEVSAANCPGLYKLLLSADEMNGNSMTPDGKSSTADITLHFYPVMTDRGDLGTVDTVVDAVKVKTDNLPASPAATGSEMDLVDALNATAVTAVQSGLAVPGDEMDLVAAFDAAKTAAQAGDTMAISGDYDAAKTAAQAGNAMTLAADAVDANAVKADAVTEIQSGLATSSALTTVDGVVDAIKAKTDNLPVSPAAVGSEMDLVPAFDAAKTAAQAGDAMTLAVDAVDANAVKTDAVTELQAGLATSAALTTVDTVVDAVKAKTDNLPGSPAAVGSEMALTDAAKTALTTAIEALTSYKTIYGIAHGKFSYDSVTKKLTVYKGDDSNTALFVWDFSTNNIRVSEAP